MKIGIVLASSPAYSETFFISKIKGLQKAGHQVILFVNNVQDDAFKICKVKTQLNFIPRNIPKIFLRLTILMLTRYRTLYHFIVKEKKDNTSFTAIIKKVIICQHILQEKDMDWLHFGFATLAIDKENVAHAIRAKMAVSIRGFDIAIYPLKFFNCYEKTWDRIDKLHYISDDLFELAIKNGFNPEKNHKKITPAIDISKFSNTSIKSYGSTVMNLLFVGRLHWKKGLEDTVIALDRLKKVGISFKYRIVGSGPEEERLKYLVYELGLNEEIEFVGKLNHKEIVSEMKESDIYIQYSIQEGFCNAVLEAQAMGLICIVSNAEGLPENVLNNVTGFVVPKYNSNLLAQKLMDVIALSETEKNKIRKNAMERVREKFNIEKQQKEFVDFYTK